MESTIYSHPRWGEIELSIYERLLIEHPYFQRLKQIHQLGATHQMVPDATDRRFEHSLGVAHLAGQVALTLQKRHPELKIGHRDVILTQLGGLCHDLGHGPYSHVFDQFLGQLPGVRSTPTARHEARSVRLTHLMMDYFPLFFTEYDRQAVASIIDPSTHSPPTGFPPILTGVVANTDHQLDVDRMEYICADLRHLQIDPVGTSTIYSLIGTSYADQVHHPSTSRWKMEQTQTVAQLLATRTKLYQNLYQRPVIKETNAHLISQMMAADRLLGLSDCSQLRTPSQIQQFVSLTDPMLDTLLIAARQVD